MTSTATASIKACVPSPPSHHANANVANAMTMTMGTNTPDTWSASRWIGAFEACASATRRTIPASNVASPMPVASHTSKPS